MDFWQRHPCRKKRKEDAQLHIDKHAVSHQKIRLGYLSSTIFVFLQTVGPVHTKSGEISPPPATHTDRSHHPGIDSTLHQTRPDRVWDPYTFFTDPYPDFFAMRTRIQVKNTFE